MSFYFCLTIIFIALMQLRNIICIVVSPPDQYILEPQVVVEILDLKHNYTHLDDKLVHVQYGADFEIRSNHTGEQNAAANCSLYFPYERENVSLDIKNGYCSVTVHNANKSHEGGWEWVWSSDKMSEISAVITMIVDYPETTTMENGIVKNTYETTTTTILDVLSSTELEEIISSFSDVTEKSLETITEQETSFIPESIPETMSTSASISESPETTTEALRTLETTTIISKYSTPASEEITIDSIFDTFYVKIIIISVIIVLVIFTATLIFLNLGDYKIQTN